ncbi:hypothetical protein QBC39DRAFT_362098 [Podospora conica]|nr:hypothetical protein QBC39DRAFT_362098 [Schizothecium conicum]
MRARPVISAVLSTVISRLAMGNEIQRPFGVYTSSNASLMRRQSGYHPEFNTCGTGTTCTEACGSGFETCLAVGSSALFCYNPRDGQTCCPGGSGRSCDAGYYCARDEKARVWCCQDDMSLDQCAALYGAATMSPAAEPLPPSPSSQLLISATTKTLLVTVSPSFTATSSGYVFPNRTWEPRPNGTSTYPAVVTGEGTRNWRGLRSSGAVMLIPVTLFFCLV